MPLKQWKPSCFRHALAIVLHSMASYIVFSVQQYNVHLVLQPVDGGWCRTHRIHGWGLPERGALPRQRVENCLGGLHGRGERLMMCTSQYSATGFIPVHWTNWCVFAAQNGEKSRHPGEFDCPPGWSWEDEWTVDDNRAVDDQGEG